MLNRRPAKFVSMAGVLLFAAFCVAIIILALTGSLPPGILKEYQYLVSFLAALLGAGSAAFALARAFSDTSGPGVKPPKARRHFFIDPSLFINRLDEARKLLGAIEATNIVCVYGQKGVGKSEFLKFASDLLRAPRRFNRKLDAAIVLKVKKRRAVYVDLFDSSSIEDVINQISHAASNIGAFSPGDLLKNIDNAYGNRSLTIVLDNLNNVASVLPVVNLAMSHREARPSDTLIFGSINRITDPRCQIAPIELLPFNSAHCDEFFQSKNLNLSTEEIQGVMNKTGGLPLFISLVAHYRDLAYGTQGGFSEYFTQEIFLKLEAGHRDLLLFISICNLSVTTLSPSDLSAFGIPYLDSKLKALHQYSSIIWTTSQEGVRIKAHDLIRDIVLRYEATRVPSVAAGVSDFFRLTNKGAAVLSALLSDRDAPDDNWIDEQIDEHIRQKDYPVVINLWDNLTEKAQPASLFSKSPPIKERLLFGYLHALLGIGNYHKARVLTQSALFRHFLSSRPAKIKTESDFDLQFALSDLDHLLNNYELARSTIEFIMGECERHGWSRELALARWQWAHLTGHIGDDLEGAIAQYAECQAAARRLAAPLLEARAFNGKAAIRFTMVGAEGISEADILGRIEAIEDTEGNGPALSALLRNLSRYYRLRGFSEKAASAIERSTDVARKTGLRTLINCDFARGENARFEARYGDAVGFYETVIAATKENGDDNLCTSAMLAVIVCDLCSDDGPVRSASYQDIEETIVYAEDTADKYHMLVTAARSHLLRKVWQQRQEGGDADLEEVRATFKRLGLERDLDLSRGPTKALRFLEIHVH